jgi:hypothetical protein
MADEGLRLRIQQGVERRVVPWGVADDLVARTACSRATLTVRPTSPNRNPRCPDSVVTPLFIGCSAAELGLSTRMPVCEIGPREGQRVPSVLAFMESASRRVDDWHCPTGPVPRRHRNAPNRKELTFVAQARKPPRGPLRSFAIFVSGHSRSNVLHQRGDLHELDARANAVETRYALQKRIGKKSLGRVF